MNINTLHEFIDLAQTLSFTKSANNFYVSQPSFSKRISALEHELGVRLFLRTGNGIQLTESGLYFAEKSKELVLHYESILEGLSYVESGKSRPIVLGYLQGASALFLPEVIAEYSRCKENPQIRYNSLEIDEVPDALKEDTADVVITTGMHQFDSSVYSERILYPDTFALIVRKGHSLASKETITLEDLKGHVLILPRKSVMPEESTKLKEILCSVAEDTVCKDLLGDIGSVQISLEAENCVAIGLYHLRHYFNKDKFDFIPLKSLSQGFSVRAVWKHTHETKALLNLVRLLEESTGDFR